MPRPSKTSTPVPHRLEEELERARQERLERDWALPMSERLARMHELCKQATAIRGAARQR